MKITKRQLRRIIRESMHDSHAYDAAKEQTAHYETESDAVMEILQDLDAIGAPAELIAKVEEAERYEEDLYYVLSLIPTSLKDQLV